MSQPDNQTQEMLKLIARNQHLARLVTNMRGEIRCLQRRLKDANRGAQRASETGWLLARKLARYGEEIKARGGTLPLPGDSNQ